MNMLFSKAVQFAIQAHKGQTRFNNSTPFVTHPLAVASLVDAFIPDNGMSQVLKAAAALHDTLEGTSATAAQLASIFPSQVVNIVIELTDDPALISSIGKTDYYKANFLRLSDDALSIKLLDRLHNLSDDPSPNMLASTPDVIKFLSANRNLSITQMAIADAIMTTINHKTFFG